MKTSRPSPAAPSAPPAPAGTERRVTTRDLFGELREIVIEHQGEQYRLRITSLNKLILTK